MSVFDEITETIKRRLGDGPAAAVVDAVISEHAGVTVYVPGQTKTHRAKRNLKLKQERKSGVAVTRISSRYSLSPSHVRRLSR